MILNASSIGSVTVPDRSEMFSDSPDERLADSYVATVERRRLARSAGIDAEQKVKFGQFFTPADAAELIAALVQLPSDEGPFRVLDPGAGVGSLAAALIARIARECPKLNVSIRAIEVDTRLIPDLETTLQEGRALIESQGGNLKFEVIRGDLVELSTGWSRELFGQFDLVLMNPPYRKLGASSWESRVLAALGIDSPNLYSAFLAIGTQVLDSGGQLVAITPRSFANGPYFGPFRRFFLSHVSFDHIHVFGSRSTVFGDSGVLQENVVFSATRSVPNRVVTLSMSHGHMDQAIARTVSYEEIVRPKDRNQFIHIPSDEADTQAAKIFARLPCTLAHLGLTVSTGRVVDFRVRDHLLAEPTPPSVPLIYPGNLRNGKVEWPRAIAKPRALVACEETKRLILPNELYVLTKRFSAKEERRRVVAAIYDPSKISGAGVGFENHINVFHVQGRGLNRKLAHGLCLWLNSSILDRFFRTFSGHTQVNATDLRSLRYPAVDQLERLGGTTLELWPDQEDIDRMVDAHILVKLA